MNNDPIGNGHLATERNSAANRYALADSNSLSNPDSDSLGDTLAAICL